MRIVTLATFLRLAFIAIMVVLGVGVTFGPTSSSWIEGMAGGVFGVVVVVLDMALKNISFRRFSHATVGLVVGVFCGVLINYVLREGFELIDIAAEGTFVTTIPQVAINVAFAYWGVALAVRANRQEFSFIIPYVRFRQDSAQDSPLLVDSNVIMEGRVARICETGFLSGALLVPRFVLDELQVLADSPNPKRRERGKRGLEYLREMQDNAALEVTIQEEYNQHEEHDHTRMIDLAKHLGARLLTNDRVLGRVAELQGVIVLNLKELAQAIRPNVLPGETLAVKLLKEGKDSHQAVGYLEDGAMVVVNHAVEHLGETVDVVIGSPVQTSAGRLIFAELTENARPKL